MGERADWRVVAQAPPPYAKCAVSGFSDGPFLDFGVRLRAANPNIQINVSVLKDAGRFVGMFDGEQYAALEQENHRLKAELGELREEVESARKFLAAIDTLESGDFRARRKPGRKPREEQVA